MGSSLYINIYHLFKIKCFHPNFIFLIQQFIDFLTYALTELYSFKAKTTYHIGSNKSCFYFDHYMKLLEPHCNKWNHGLAYYLDKLPFLSFVHVDKSIWTRVSDRLFMTMVISPFTLETFLTITRDHMIKSIIPLHLALILNHYTPNLINPLFVNIKTSHRAFTSV